MIAGIAAGLVPWRASRGFRAALATLFLPLALAGCAAPNIDGEAVGTDASKGSDADAATAARVAASARRRSAAAEQLNAEAQTDVAPDLRPIRRAGSTPLDEPASAVTPVTVEPPDESADTPADPKAALKGEFARGGASWYGLRFHNRSTASGEKFDLNAFTAAHRTLPFGTKVCVRSLVNGRTVLVRINDRGPHAPGRIIDLSRAAAEDLGMLGLGIKQVALSFPLTGRDDCDRP